MKLKFLLFSLILLFASHSVLAEDFAKAEYQNKLKKINNIAEFKNFINKHQDVGVVSGYNNVFLEKGMTRDLAMPTAMADGAGFMGAEFSNTNVQVEGVDEADIIKTDGKYIYAVSGNDLLILEAVPVGQAKVLTTINFKDQPREIFLNNNTLTVIGLDYNFGSEARMMSWIRRSSYTFVKVFDVSNKTKPVVKRSLRLEGDYTSSRVVAGKLYLITSAYDYQLDEVVLPRVYEDEKLITSEKNTNRYSVPNIYYFDYPYRNFNTNSISVIDLNNHNEAIKTELYLLPSGETIYVSNNAIYFTYNKYFNQSELMMQVARNVVWSKLAESDKVLIKKIEAVDDQILNSEEKIYKINTVVNRYLRSLSEKNRVLVNDEIEKTTKVKLVQILDQLQVTVIHKININDSGLKYSGLSEVPGRVINQFSFDELDGNLRVATTRDAVTNVDIDDKRSNGVYVLDPAMKLIGRLDKLALDEQIYAVRFMQNRLYLVTFLQTDPLFVIDVANPRKPTVLGELKIPGFSQYLHPYNNNILIGIGRNTEVDASARVLTKGLKIALFDVRNVSAPKEIAKLELGGLGSYSEVLSNHKAFMFFKDKNLMAIPARLNKMVSGNNWGALEFEGALIFEVTDKSLSLRGKISHQAGYRADEYQKQVRRILYLDNNIYTLSDTYLKINKLDNLQEVKTITLREDEDFIIKN